MTPEQITFAAQEAPAYTDADMFVSDLLLSSAFSAPDSTEGSDITLAEPLRRVWIACAAPFRDFLSELQVTQSAAARRYRIPLRTVQGWAEGTRTAPIYIRLMMAEIAGWF